MAVRRPRPRAFSALTRTLQALMQLRRSHAASPNIIPDEALLRLDVRTFDAQVREAVLSAIKRIISAEATASRAPKPPTFTVVGEFPLTTNDEAATSKSD